MRTSAANYARMGEHVSPYNRVLDMPWAMGAWAVDSAPALAKLSNEIARQSVLIGYMNAWLLYTIVALASLPLCLLARLPKTAATRRRNSRTRTASCRCSIGEG